MDKAMPIALSHQVKEGPAKILTVIDQDKVEAFDIEVVSTVPQKFPATKGMVIKVTDKRLLAKTGGIVQDERKSNCTKWKGNWRCYTCICK